ncbi:hypothetical protein [Corallococcus macrosporus]|uniref:MoxR-vWA-beta-propeller ternary system domain-containing protein n=1 Tax=Corallococcus macrosporus DSM 14697 TaxID=1189310 RepID=A0A250K574_9BACT|nr:hypothetical protein [Corallococcus macrosporus]ATB51060.1 hypothetical protein MYMAC_006717 [Corallococcus macrosporus DSM 14697]
MSALAPGGGEAARVPVRWRSRAEPLEPLAVAGEGAVAVALARRILAEDDARLAHWEGVAGPGLLVLLGASASLPWVDGAVYLGRDDAAPSLLVPCALAPDVAAPLLERALLAQAHGGGTLLAVLPASLSMVSVAAARSVSRVTLQAWLDASAPRGSP